MASPEIPLLFYITYVTLQSKAFDFLSIHSLYTRHPDIKGTLLAPFRPLLHEIIKSVKLEGGGIMLTVCTKTHSDAFLFFTVSLRDKHANTVT